MPISLIAALVLIGLGLAAAIQWWQSGGVLWMLGAVACGIGSAFLLRQHFRKP
jgi:hypothetical protein